MRVSVCACVYVCVRVSDRQVIDPALHRKLLTHRGQEVPDHQVVDAAFVPA